MRDNRMFLSVLICVLLVFNRGLRAQDTPKDDEDLLKKLLDVKISTASRYNQSISEAPASVTIITAEEIEKYGYRTLEEILWQVRGFYITNDRNYTYVGIRGFSRPSDYNNRILMMVNSHAVNENIWGSSFMSNELGIDVNAIERIEIVRGPGSALYGTGAMLTVINIITRPGKTVDGLKLMVQTGSYGKLHGGAQYGKEFKNGLDLFVSGQITDSKGADLYFDEFDDPSTNNGVAEGLDWEKYYSFFTAVKYKNFSLQGTFASREKGIPTAPYTTAFNDDRQKTRDDWRFLELKYKTNFNYNTEFMVRGYFCNYYYYGAFPYDSEEYTTLWEDESDGQWLGFESQFNWDIRPDNRLVTGVEYKNHIRALYHSWDEYDTLFDRDFPFTEFSCYIQDEHQVLENLSLTLGVRYDRYSDRGKFFSPRAALVYNPSRRTTLKLLYGRAFRAPNIYELYYESPGEAKSNPFLNEEKINTFETIIEQKLSDHIFGVLSFYRYEMRDLIEQEFDFTDELLQFRNIEKVRGNGIEFGLNAYFKNGFLWYINGAVQDAKNVLLAEKISNSPMYIFKMGLSVPALKYFFISLEAFYESKRLTLHGSWTNPFLLANLHLCSRTLSDFCKFSLQIRNLFDVEYSTPAGYEHIQHALIQGGRTFTLQLDLILK